MRKSGVLIPKQTSITQVKQPRLTVSHWDHHVCYDQSILRSSSDPMGFLDAGRSDMLSDMLSSSPEHSILRCTREDWNTPKHHLEVLLQTLVSRATAACKIRPGLVQTDLSAGLVQLTRHRTRSL